MTNPQLQKNVLQRWNEFLTFTTDIDDEKILAFLAAELARKDEEKARIIKEIEKVKYVMPHDDYQEGRNDGLSNAISIIDSESQKETE